MIESGGKVGGVSLAGTYYTSCVTSVESLWLDYGKKKVAEICKRHVRKYLHYVTLSAT